MEIRKAIKTDIPGILELLLQVDMVHHNGRPVTEHFERRDVFRLRFRYMNRLKEPMWRW